MKKKMLIGIILLCVVLVILFLVFWKKTENNEKNIGETTDNTTYKLTSYTTSKTFYITGPKGYKYDEDQTGTFNSKAVFDKSNNIDTSLIYSFESMEMDKYFESKKRVCYENRLDSDYYKNLAWQDQKTENVNGHEIRYVKVTYNDGTTYYNEIYSMATVQGWTISCEITQDGETNSFESDSKLIEDAWEISFIDEDNI